MQTQTHIPTDIYCAADYARLAQSVLTPAIYAHAEGGSAHGISAAANLSAFANLAIVPRLLRCVSDGHIRCTIGGVERPHPIMLAPVGSQALFHPQAELDTAMAARAMQSCLVASTMSSLTLEDIAAAAGEDRWFQLYFQPDRAVTADLAARAEAAGYGALVVTLDTPIQIPGFVARRAGYVAPDDAANLRQYPSPAAITINDGQSMILNGLMSRAPSWDDLDWLIGETGLPVWVKGVMHADDARALAARGVAGIIVSNHGGRSLDGAPASLAMLPSIRAALTPDFPVLFDGGIRSGADIFKAIALGADAVLVGRLQAFALAANGALGVAHMIRLLQEELQACMALSGCATLDDIRAAQLVPVGSAMENPSCLS